MTTKDSSADKLVASIRKTKAGLASRSTSTPEPAAKTPAKVVAKKATVKKKAVTRRTTRKNVGNKSQLIDLFQSAGRVWPD